MTARKTLLRYDLRIVWCEGCGAPLEAAQAGGRVGCRYCDTHQTVPLREERALEVGRRLEERERIAALRAQDRRPPTVSPRLSQLLFAARVLPWRVPIVESLWQRARRAARPDADAAAQADLFELTVALARHYERRGDLAHVRAVTESALDRLTSPRHRQVLRAGLARLAALSGDLEAAEAWLAPCDPRSSDLEADGAYRIAAALTGTLRGDWGRVCALLGRQHDEVPLPDELDPEAAILRSNAWERAGQLDTAIATLRQFAEHAGPPARLAAATFREAARALDLAPQSHARASALWRPSEARSGSGMSGAHVLLAVLGVVFFVVAVGGSVAAKYSGLMFAIEAAGGGIWVGVFGCLAMVFTVTGAEGLLTSYLRERRLLRGRELPAAVVAAIPTGTEAMGVPEFRVRVLVFDGPAAFVGVTTFYADALLQAALVPGRACVARVTGDGRELAIEVA